LKRRIAAVLIAKAAGLSRALAAEAEVARVRAAEYRAIIADTVAHGGGRVLSAAGDEPLLAEFQSAVQAVRAALDAQETLRIRNKELALAERLDFKLGITIGEVTDGAPEGACDASPEAVSDAGRLASLAAPGGVGISRTVREAIASKLKGHIQDLTVEGEPFVAYEAVPAPSSPPTLTALIRNPIAIAGLAAVLAIAAGASVLSWRDADRETRGPADEREVALLTPAPSDTAPPADGPAPKSKLPLGSGGSLEFIPAVAPDPATVLSAERMLPQAWKNCQEGSADAAAGACKTLIDSGLVKGEELAQIQMLSGRALRDRHDADKALEALNASIALKPTPAAFALRGTVHYDAGDWERAIADYSEAIRLDGANGEAFNNRAWTYYRAGKPDKALPDADTAVRLLARQAYVWDTRGHIHAALGNREAAIADFREALARDPDSADSKAGLARLGVN
jgi:class 3 adenylate cyclase/predicted negative regulator of RcsB-dependent stress response